MISPVQLPPSAGSAPWMPSHRSPIAGLVWRTFAAGRTCGWKAGRIVWPAPEAEDEPWQPGHMAWHGAFSSPDWISALIARLDALVPPADDILRLLDPDSLTLGTEPAALRIPASPCAAEAGACAAAARVLIACREELVTPAFVPPDKAVSAMEHAACMALMIGGEAAFLSATETLSDPASYALNPVAEDVPLIVVEGEGD